MINWQVAKKKKIVARTKRDASEHAQLHPVHSFLTIKSLFLRVSLLAMEGTEGCSNDMMQVERAIL